MRKTHFFLFAGFFAFLFTACSDSNPTNFYAESSSSKNLVSSSTIISISSSNEVFSSSFEINSSNSFSSSSTTPISYGKLIDDRDGHVYKTIKIGEQTWMAENLNYAYLQPTSTKDSSSECYNNVLDNCTKFGRLYLWSAAMDSAAIFSLDGKGCGKGSGSCKQQPSKGVRGVCPENWHIPTGPDMSNYVNYANSSIESQYSVKQFWIDGALQTDLTKDSIGKKHAILWGSVDLYGQKFNDNNVKGIDLTSFNNVVKTDTYHRGEIHAIRCVKDDQTIQVEHGTMTDERDGQVYKTVKIGDQWWMAENLNYELPKQEFYGFESTLSLCYNNEPDSCAKYGRLYTFAAATDCCPISPNYINSDSYSPHGICPENWHIPSVNEWKILLNVVNGFATDLKSTSGWLDDGNGYDNLDFKLLPAGYYRNYEILEDMGFGYDVPEFDDDSKKIEFTNNGQQACYWTPKHSTRGSFYGDTYQLENAYSFCFSNDKKGASFNMEYKIYAYSVRCVKDSEAK